MVRSRRSTAVVLNIKYCINAVYSVLFAVHYNFWHYCTRVRTSPGVLQSTADKVAN